MSSVIRYERITEDHNHNCIDCQRAFRSYDNVIKCDIGHVFHQSCWPGACSTAICKNRRWEENLALAKISGSIAVLALICVTLFKVSNN